MKNENDMVCEGSCMRNSLQIGQGVGEATCLSSLPQSHGNVFNSDMGTVICLSDLKHMFSKIYFRAHLSCHPGSEFLNSPFLASCSTLSQVYHQGSHCKVIILLPTCTPSYESHSFVGCYLLFVLYHTMWLSTVVQYLLNIDEWGMCEASLTKTAINSSCPL